MSASITEAPAPGREVRRGRAVPAVSVAILVVAIVGATVGLARPAAEHVAWLPPDGHRVRFVSATATGARYAEWSTPSGLSLSTQSALLVFPEWLAHTKIDAMTAGFAMLHSIQVGADGSGTRLSDRMWSVGPDGARAEIEVDVTAEGETTGIEAAVLLPGRLDLPADLAPGDKWTSEGTARTWDPSAGAFVENPYRASFDAAAAADTGEAARGCLDVAMDQTTGDATRTESRTWCPGTGIVRFTDKSGTWTPSAADSRAPVDPAEPFDWGTAASLEFTPRTVNQASVPGSLTLSPVSPPGLLGGGAVVAERLFPDLLGLSTSDDPVRIVWSARPGGMLSASATLGGVTVVTTTARQAVAYNNQGRWLWETRLSDVGVAAPVRFGDQVVIAALDGSVTALELASGALVWRAELGAEIRVPPVVAGDKLLVANQAGALACLDANGAQLWVTDAGVPSSMAVSSGADPVVVYGTNGSVVLRAYSIADGRQVWRNRVYQDPRDLIALDSVVVVRDNDATLGVDWTTGAVRWQWAADRTVTGLGGGQRVLLLGASELVLLDDAGQAVRTWPHHVGDVTNGTAYLVADGKTVLAYGPSGMEIGALP